MTAIDVAVRFGTAVIGMTLLAIGVTIAAVIKYAAGDSRGAHSLIGD